MYEGKLSSKLNHRVLYLDALRGLAIFMVILIHTSAANWSYVPINSIDWQWFNIYDSLARPAVPLFVMISGTFLLDPSRKYSKTKLNKKILRILTAYLIWSTIYALIWLVQSSNYGIEKNVCTLLHELLINIILGNYHLWFCYLIIGLYLITPILRKFTDDRSIMKRFIVLAIIFTFFGNVLKALPKIDIYFIEILDKFSMDFVSGYVCYYLLGYYLKTTEISKKKRYIIYIAASISVAFTVLMTKRVSMSNDEAIATFYNNLNFNVFIPSVAIFIMFKNSVNQNTEQNKKRLIITSISECSFGIYLVHPIFLDIFNCYSHKINIMSYPAVVSVPFISFLIFMFSYFAVYILGKISFVKKYAL